MKKNILLVLLFSILLSQEIFADFRARNLNDAYSWYTQQILKFETKHELYGLFFQTTINLKLKLGQEERYSDNYPYTSYCAYPPAGTYEFIWTFSLPQNAFIKDLLVWDNSSNSFKETSTIDLTTGEQFYNSNSTDPLKVLLKQYMRRDYNGSYNLQYDLRISPVQWNESAEFIIKIVSPCEIAVDKRIVDDFSNQFYSYYDSRCFSNVPAEYLVIDYNNPDSQPQFFNGSLRYNNVISQWNKLGNFWQASANYINSPRFFFPAESSSGKFLQTSSIDQNHFYQLTTKPFIKDELRYPRKIVLAFDLNQEYISSYSRNNFLLMIKDALLNSITSKDSIAFVTSDFNVKWLNNNFSQASESFINSNLNSINNIIPKLNTLPYMLKDIVSFLNEKNTDAEVWLVSNDYQTGNRAETVMELLDQTYYKAKNKIKFNIIDTGGGSGYYIQNKYYRGNEYLYENLTRLSGGNFNKIYDLYYLYYIDQALDCWAPKVSTVEIDPMPQSGFSYSRINLNNNKNNFDITARYGQYGLMEGNAPFTVSYFGNYLNESYFNTIELTEDNSTIPEEISKNVGLYWFGNYIMKDLFLQPQSYSTIKYIEELSVKYHIITPYSAFIIPAPSGYSGYIRQYEDEIVSVEHNNDDENTPETLPSDLNISAYPNPFNPQTTIVIKLSGELNRNEIKLDIFNILGQKVKSFDLSGYSNPYELKIDWNGLNDFGSQVSSGTYFVVLRTGHAVRTLKLLLVR